MHPNAHVFSWLVIFESDKKKVFLWVFKNTDLYRICASIVFKAKTKEKHEDTFCCRFLFQNSKIADFWNWVPKNIPDQQKCVGFQNLEKSAK